MRVNRLISFLFCDVVLDISSLVMATCKVGFEFSYFIACARSFMWMRVTSTHFMALNRIRLRGERLKRYSPLKLPSRLLNLKLPRKVEVRQCNRPI